MARKLAVRFSDDELRIIKKIADRENITANSALKKLLVYGAYIDEKLDGGNTLIIREQNGVLKEVEFRI
jgi:hypothetical protein